MSEKRSKRIVDRKNALLRERLKSSRRDAGYTQKEFAEKLGVYRLTLQKYEAGDIEWSQMSISKGLARSAGQKAGQHTPEIHCR